MPGSGRSGTELRDQEPCSEPQQGSGFAPVAQHFANVLTIVGQPFPWLLPNAAHTAVVG